MSTEIASRASFAGIRYAQCWEDADVLLEALNVQPGHVCVSIASAGDNTLALLTRNPQKVFAIDLSPAQLACLELRIAAYRTLEHAELLALIGSRPSRCRSELYCRCRAALSPAARAFWDSRPREVAHGIGGAGKFERYFALFRKRVLPLVHSRGDIARLLRGGTPGECTAYYDRQWDTWRWRLLFRVFFSRFLMGRLGRDPSFFTYVEGNIADRLLARTRHAVTTLNPAENPYLHWILTGQHGAFLPLALRREHFDTIRANLDRVEWHCMSLEDFLNSHIAANVDCFNLSDIFEYMSLENTRDVLAMAARCGRRGARLAYWNTLVPRSRPESLADVLRPLSALAEQLHHADRAFFYSRLVVEEIA